MAPLRSDYKLRNLFDFVFHCIQLLWHTYSYLRRVASGQQCTHTRAKKREEALLLSDPWEIKIYGDFEIWLESSVTLWTTCTKWIQPLKLKIVKLCRVCTEKRKTMNIREKVKMANKKKLLLFQLHWEIYKDTHCWCCCCYLNTNDLKSIPLSCHILSLETIFGRRKKVIIYRLANLSLLRTGKCPTMAL